METCKHCNAIRYLSLAGLCEFCNPDSPHYYPVPWYEFHSVPDDRDFGEEDHNDLDEAY